MDQVAIKLLRFEQEQISWSSTSVALRDIKTLYALSSCQFYQDCKIMGMVDFIFGNAIDIFQSYEINASLSIQGQQKTLR
ncbi:hypothetical protein L7F22_007979 [Adiantum nelumboides]|nr:hypothetical protein [Adiantum nelumboides]